MTWPVTNPASSEARKATTPTTSAGSHRTEFRRRDVHDRPGARLGQISLDREHATAQAADLRPLSSQVPQRRLNLPEPLGDGIGFRYGQLGHLTPPGAALLERARHRVAR